MQISLTADISYVPFFNALKNSRPSLRRYRIEKQSMKIKIPLIIMYFYYNIHKKKSKGNKKGSRKSPKLLLIK